MNRFINKYIFIFFLLSGFCGIAYQTIWLRLAMASFGVNSQVISVVVSVFMLGLALGSWFSGRYLIPFILERSISPLLTYGLTELMIGLGAFAVPTSFKIGENLLLNLGQTNSMGYIFLSVTAIIIGLLPWCFFMGITIPLVTSYLKLLFSDDNNLFSFLYYANTVGAILGAFLSAFVFVELFGFSVTLKIAAFINFFIAVSSWALAFTNKSLKFKRKSETSKIVSKKGYMNSESNIENKVTLVLLFLTGFVSMGFEIIWTRLYISLLGTTVYSFAAILIIYLIGTVAGTYNYRKNRRNKNINSTLSLLYILVVVAIVQIPFNDPRVNLRLPAMAATIGYFSYILGYLTPKQIDGKAKGDHRVVGFLYAVNVLGCILGPVVTSYFLLPRFGAKLSIIFLTLPLTAVLIYVLHNVLKGKRLLLGAIYTTLILAIFLTKYSITYEDGKEGPNKVIKRDYSATVTAYDFGGQDKTLLVNSIGMTFLNPITKNMAHIPAVLLKRKPESVLVICFGMGTTFRSSLSWGADTTAIELIPSVAELFGYFFDDADTYLNDPKGRIVIDDGRRYLQRVEKTYDLILIDPPPPVETSGSSLLYSTEFYKLAQKRLAKGGILQQWLPYQKGLTLNAVARSLSEVFPYVIVYPSIEQGFGYHFLASDHKLENPTPDEFVQAMPDRALKDLMEWNKDNDKNAVAYAKKVISDPKDVTELLVSDKNIVITDDRPYNEYFMLRYLFL